MQCFRKLKKFGTNLQSHLQSEIFSISEDISILLTRVSFICLQFVIFSYIVFRFNYENLERYR